MTVGIIPARRKAVKVTILGVSVLAAALILACGGDGSPDSTAGSQSEEERIRAAVERVYDLTSDERLPELWDAYSSDFRERCSFDAMVETVEDLKDQGVDRLEVSGFSDIEFIGDRAQARYSVVGFDDAGQETAQYDYDVTLVKENDQWLFEESCF